MGLACLWEPRQEQGGHTDNTDSYRQKQSLETKCVPGLKIHNELYEFLNRVDRVGVDIIDRVGVDTLKCITLVTYYLLLLKNIIIIL